MSRFLLLLIFEAPSPNSHSELLFIIPYIFLLTCTEINDFKFFPFFFAKILHSYSHNSYVSICKDLQKTIVSSSGPFIEYLHLQNNVFVNTMSYFRCIYNTLIVNVRNSHLMRHNLVAVFKSTLFY